MSEHTRSLLPVPPVAGPRGPRPSHLPVATRRLLIALVLLLTLAGGLTPPARALAPLAGPDTFAADLAYSHVQSLAVTIGSRPAGSEADTRAAAYIADTLRGFGYAVDVPSFTFTNFEDLGSGLSVGDVATENVRALNGSVAGVVEAPVVYVGLARPEDLPANLAGKIALAERGEITFQAKLANVQAAGAAGLIVYNNQPGPFTGSLGGASTIPAVSIAQEAGQPLRAAVAAGGVTARIETRTEQRPMTSQNVVAHLPEMAGAGPRVVIGAHYDSVAAGPGANDNGSGTAAMLELARVVAQTRPAVDVTFIAFGAEELGLVGSRNYVRSLPEADRTAIALMINLDMVGVGDQLLIGGSDAVARDGIKLAAGMGLTATKMGGGLNGASDHASFLQAGIPAAFIYWSDDPNYHKATDRADFVRPDLLKLSGDLALQLATSATATGAARPLPPAPLTTGSRGWW